MNTRRLFGAGALILASIGLCASSVQAATIAAIQSTNGPQQLGFTGFAGASSSDSIGWSFTVGAANVTVTALGVLDPGGAALASSHEIGLWNSTGTTLLADATVPSGTGGTLMNNYSYTSISPVILNAGATYVVGAFYPTGNTDQIILNSTQTIAPEIAFGQSEQSDFSLSNPGLAFPSAHGGNHNEGIFGPNFLLSTADPAPEPGTPLLVGLGAAALLAGRFWRRSSRRERSRNSL
jgi:hypothetical protein